MIICVCGSCFEPASQFFLCELIKQTCSVLQSRHLAVCFLPPLRERSGTICSHEYPCTWPGPFSENKGGRYCRVTWQLCTEWSYVHVPDRCVGKNEKLWLYSLVNSHGGDKSSQPTPTVQLIGRAFIKGTWLFESRGLRSFSAKDQSSHCYTCLVTISSVLQQAYVERAA